MAFTQNERLCILDTPLGPDELLVRSAICEEGVSTLFRFQLDLISERDDIPFHDLIGQNVTIKLETEKGKFRHFNGYVSTFSQGMTVGRFTAYRAQVVPWLWFLSRKKDCRIFQHKSVPDIVKSIFDELGFVDFELQLQGSYPERDYVVQYRESCLDFVQRLLEDVGIGYYFKHDDKLHTLCLFDSIGGNIDCPEQAQVAFISGENKEKGEIDSWYVEQELHTGKWAMTDYNFESPSTDLRSERTTSTCIAGNDKYEIYDYPGTYGAIAQGDRLTQLRMEEEESCHVMIEGRGHCPTFSSGHCFQLSGHGRDEFNGKYMLLSCTHRIRQGVGDERASESFYENRFRCVPSGVTFRPRRVTPRPVITGLQTATVTGASGSEIDVDEYGRVVVQFHWDREGKKDEQSSCRVRVAQNSAGKGWGLIVHPRIGQEVVVQFLEGDPDKPLIVGMVYNAEQMPPYGLPGEMNKSGLKSNSTKGGGGYNELVFDDTKGSELVNVQAEKDLTRLIKNNESDSVGADRSRSVGNDETVQIGNDRKKTVGANETVSIVANHTESVGGDESLAVTGSRTRTVGVNETVTVTAQRTHSVGVNETISVGGAQEVTVGGLQAITVGAIQEVNIGANHNLSVGGNESIDIGSKQSVSVGGDRSLDVNGGLSEKVAKDYAHKTEGTITIEAGKELVLKVGSATFVMKSNGDFLIDGKKIDVKGSGDIVMKASKIKSN